MQQRTCMHVWRRIVFNRNLLHFILCIPTAPHVCRAKCRVVECVHPSVCLLYLVTPSIRTMPSLLRMIAMMAMVLVGIDMISSGAGVMASSKGNGIDPLQWTIDNFVVSYQTQGYMSLSVVHIPTSRTVWQSTPKRWLTVHRISSQRVDQYGGTYHMTQGGSSTCSDISVTDTQPAINTSTSVVTIQGRICGTTIPWLMNITSPLVNHLKFDVQLQLPSSSDLRAGMNFVPLDKTERFFGMGHQYTHFDLRYTHPCMPCIHWHQCMRAVSLNKQIVRDMNH